MAFDQNELGQLKEMFEVQQSSISSDMQMQLEQFRSEIAGDTRSIVSESEERLLKRMDRIIEMESGDINVAYQDIDVLKKKAKDHESRITALER